MHDIFISYSSANEDKAKEVCERIEHQGIKCWFAERKEDCTASDNYIQLITEAIDSSKAFILILSNDSVSSPQVNQEVTIANERQRFGLKLFAVNVAPNGEVDMELFHKKIGYVFAGRSSYRWHDPGEVDTMFRDLWDCLNAGRSKDVAELVTYIPHAERVVGRAEELGRISEYLSTHHRLWISGMGGIGKSALMISYCKNMGKSDYSKVIFMSVDKCIAQTLDDDRQLQLNNENITENRKKLTNYEYALYKLSVLENSVDDTVLVVLDNVENYHDPLFERLCQLRCDVVVISRYTHSIPAEFKHIQVKQLRKAEDLYKLFELYYGEAVTAHDFHALDDLMESVHFHTMTIVLIAKQLKYFGKKPSDYRDKNQIIAERILHLPQIMSGSANDAGITEMYLQLFDLFDVTTLSAQEKTVMKILCLLPAEGLHRHLFLSLLGSTYFDTVIKLEKMGWIQTDSDNNFLLIHPLVRDVVIHELGLYVDDPDISLFISKVVSEIKDSWKKTYEENIKYKNIVLSIYFLFPTPTLSRHKDYLVISKYLWILNYMDISLEIQNKVKSIFISESGQHNATSDEAETLLQIGFTQHGKGDYSGAEKELTLAAQLFGNRYAAALSHLAQAKMEKGQDDLESIEPLLKESLQIREKYWKNTLSEAASCHLYAKVLSAFQQKLEYAITLEKRAYQIFTRLQPNTTNVSSAAYILGWLYVLTAEDMEDIEYGIEKLEEAKEIRTKSRDRLHPWMEDIYLKLGLANEKKNDYCKASEYYQLLIEVRERKYSSETSGEHIKEAYQLLCGAYEKLGDEAGLKKCQKKLRYLL